MRPSQYEISKLYLSNQLQVLVSSISSWAQVADPTDPDDASDGPTFTYEVDGISKKAGIMLDAQVRDWIYYSF